MNIIETILSTDGGAVVKQIATQFGIGTDQAASAASVLLPVLAGVQVWPARRHWNWANL